MNETQKKSLELIEELFKNMDGDEFLKEHESLEKNIGPTIEFFLENLQKDSYSSFIKMKPERVSVDNSVEIKEKSSPHYGEINFSSANDENYKCALAA